MRPEAWPAALTDRLAAEYVLGTLRGPARARFARWREQHAGIARQCEAWEQRLAGLASAAPPVTPPPRIWLAIEQGTGLAGNVRLWRLVASLALLGLLAALVGPLQRAWAPRPDEIAEIGPAGGAVRWRIEVYGQRLVMRAPVATAKPADRDFELWVLPADGSRAISLGVMPVQGARAERLDARQAMALMAGARVAVSVEPVGGSPTGQATGPVILVAPLHGAG